MPSSVRFPRALDNDSSLYLVVNNKRTRLTSNISDTATTIPVITTSGFPTVGFVSILTGADILKTEAIAYSGTGATNFLNAERGADGTTAFTHNANDNVDLTIVSRHHNNIKDAVIELERYIGVSGTERFVPFQFPGGNVILPGTLSVQNTITVSGGAQFAFVTVTGTLTVGGNFDFKHDGAISGTLTVGEIPVATGTPSIPFDLEEGTFTSSSTTYVDVTDSQTDPLPVGNCLLLYSMSVGSVSGTPSVNGKCVFAGADVGEEQGSAFLSGDPWGGINLGGFKIVTGDAANAAKLQIDLDTASSTVAVSARGLLAIPLATMGLVVDQDYWFSNGSESTVNITSSTFSDVTTVVAVLPAAGDYLVFGSAEMNNGIGAQMSVRYQIDSTTISATYKKAQSISNQFKTFPFARLLNTTAGSHTFRVQAAFTGGTATIKRARLCIIRAAAFSKVSGLTSATDFSTASGAFAKIPSSEITFTPNQRESIVVIANPDAFITSLTGPPSPTYKLVNETSGLEYMLDSSPARFQNVTTDIIPTLMFTKIDNVATAQTFSLSFRDGEATGNTVTSTDVNMIVWSMTTTVTSDDILFTTIDGEHVRTGRVETDNLEVYNTATVSGIPVMINVPDPLRVLDAYFNLVAVTGSLTISGVPVSTGTITNAVFSLNNTTGNITITGTGGTVVTTIGQIISITTTASGSSPTLQDAYNNGNGVIVTVSGKPVVISGTPNDRGVEFKVVGSGVITEALTIGQGTTYIDDHSITTGSGIFSTSLTVSGSPVLNAASTQHGSMNFTTSLTVSGSPVLNAASTQHGSMNFTTSLTVSGQPVSTGTVDTAVLDARYVNVTGDSMTGNLNMQGRLVQDAGVARVQNSAPSVTVTGLFWFDADAVGSFPSDPTIAKGGVFASTSVMTSGINVADNTITTIPWDTSVSDSGSWFSFADRSRLTVPSGVSHVQLNATVRFTFNATGFRQVIIYKNGVNSNITPASGIGFSNGRWGNTVVQTVSGSATDTVVQILTPIITVSGGDYFQVAVSQNSGGNLTVTSGTSWFSALASNTRGVPGVNSVNALKGDISVLAGNSISIASDSGTNAITISGTTTLQTAYDNGSSTITTTVAKPLTLAGTGRLVAVTGTFSSGLTVGGSSTHILPDSITTASGVLTSALNIPRYVTDPASIANGDLWINTTTSGLRWKTNGLKFEIQGTIV